MRKLTYTLRESFSNNNISKIAGCHNPLSAKLAQEAGFEAVWFSGFEYSTSMCLPDASILTMSDHLSMISSITRAIHIPLIADCDSGFGDANNVAYMVKEYEQAGVAGVCIEDKVFPKLNSFCDKKQDLISTEEFCLKLLSANNARSSKEFMIIARLESLIAGKGIEDAVLRANAYIKAGADIILIHSKASDVNEIKQFIENFGSLTPIIIIPTTYYKTTLEEINRISPNIKGVIYANQGIRASIKAIKSTYANILANGTSEKVENDIVSIQEAFLYQGMKEYIQNYEYLKKEFSNLL